MGDEKRATLSLPLTVSDKKTLKTMAAQRDTTIAAIIHEWVQKHLEKVSEQWRRRKSRPICGLPPS